jgi:hypothetical protein
MVSSIADPGGDLSSPHLPILSAKKTARVTAGNSNTTSSNSSISGSQICEIPVG